MAKMRIRKDDKVRVIAGKDKGTKDKPREGRVLRTNPGAQRVVVERVSVAKKAVRPTQRNQAGGFVEIEQPIHVSNVKLICPKCGEPTRVGLRRDDGKRVRVCKKCGKDID
ncbi:MAG: 50S ribosomal protein L24 [Coriobacteriia bacterium]|nr:50S ribosomal protein L24 [Coriobacteriia bacterium]MCL2870405.1 50S ribosomal protein L24 [Coriobacteriia bacterium]